jgi:predicted ATPase
MMFTESSLITSTFCRVRSSGKSEALLIGGYSGSGKTRLVESVLKYLDVDGVSSHVVTLKSDERSSSSVITQALDRLCVVIKEKSSEEECQRINARLVDAFADSSFLLELLPNAKLLYDAKRAKPSLHQGSEIQSNSASFILRLFMRAVSNKDRPVVLFLDDLQWCDNASLEIVQDILSDTKSDSCVYFIGCFRDTECNSDHPIFKMMEAMNTNNVAIKLLGLGGVNRNELNCMTSDALCILPRHCKELSDILHTKTRGDPYFAIEMLKELVDQRLLQFNFQRRRWVWNEASIMYLDVTTNVLNLLKTKMMTMPKEIQAALKVCSCFSSIDSQKIVACLSESAEYSNLRDELDRAVEEGFLDKVGDGGYKFVHDRVKEAAYGLIRETERNGFHYGVGMMMLSSSNVGDSLVQTVTDQINRGGVTIQSGKDRIAVAELNYKAGTQAMTQSAFVKALSYFETAKNLLPTDYWQSQYYFGIRLFLSLSNAAFACGHGEMADEALESILREAKCLEDKLDAYYFKNNLLFHRGQANVAFSKCAEVLQELGETIPKEVGSRDLVDMVEKVLHFFKSQRDDQLLHFKEIDSQVHFYLMQFYHQLSFFAYFGQTPSLQAFLSCRSVAIAIQCGFCKYSSIALASFASILCGKFKDVSNGYRIGSVALQLLTRFEATSLIPAVYLHFYGMVAHHKEPILDVSDKLHKGFQIGMSVGDSTIALMNGLHYIQKSFVGGRNLNVISKDIEYQLELCDTHGDRRTKRFMSLFNETICQVKAKTDIISTGEGAAEQDEAMKIEGFSEVILFHRIIQTFWLGVSCSKYLIVIRFG